MEWRFWKQAEMQRQYSQGGDVGRTRAAVFFVEDGATSVGGMNINRIGLNKIYGALLLF